ncbi:MAG: hypothetical protein E7453_06995 [Ruminococcaceae bacterium]|nr:hypothetical protein [Oscillospiraceae bacterium]
MSRFDVLTEELYNLSIVLDNYSKQTFFSKKQTATLTKTLSAMHFLFSCLQKETINDDDAHTIIDTLENILHTRYFDFASNLLKSEELISYNTQLKELLFEASYTISLCIGSLCNKEKNYKETVRRHVATIQIITKTVLPPKHSAWLSIEDANKAIKTILKCD